MDLIKKFEKASKILSEIEVKEGNIISDEVKRIKSAENGNAISTPDAMSLRFNLRATAIGMILAELDKE